MGMSLFSFKLAIAAAFALPTAVQSATVVPRSVTCPTGQVTANAQCCPLFPIVDLIQTQLFDGGKCNEEAHSALRLAFHDAIGYSIWGGKGGGADGSILTFASTETAYHANGGTDDTVADQTPIWVQSGLSAGDFVHLAAAIGTGNCPGAPRLQYKFGRPPPQAAAPDKTVPEPTDSVTAILTRFAEAGFSSDEVVALLASHSIAAADVVDPTVPGSPFDSTVGTFDSQIYLEVLLKGTSYPGNGSHVGELRAPIRGEMRLQSDFAISQDLRTACAWQLMINNQDRMMSQFKAAMAKLQTLGQSNLVDCSDVIPVPQPFTGSIKYPPTFTRADVQTACILNGLLVPCPDLETAPGPAITLSPVDL